MRSPELHRLLPVRSEESWMPMNSSHLQYSHTPSDQTSLLYHYYNMFHRYAPEYPHQCHEYVLLLPELFCGLLPNAMHINCLLMSVREISSLSTSVRLPTPQRARASTTYETDTTNAEHCDFRTAKPFHTFGSKQIFHSGKCIVHV